MEADERVFVLGEDVGGREAKGLYGFFRPDLWEPAPLGDYDVPAGKASLKREEGDITLRNGISQPRIHEQDCRDRRTGPCQHHSHSRQESPVAHKVYQPRRDSKQEHRT
jgi:hypothetical protein